MSAISFIGFILLNFTILIKKYRKTKTDRLEFSQNDVFVAAELKMDVLREREVKDNLERQLLDEQKMRGKLYHNIQNAKIQPREVHTKRVPIRVVL